MHNATKAIFTKLNEYEIRHLVEHLALAGSSDNLRRLLAFEDNEGHNAWYMLREHRGETDGYVVDVMRGWRVAALSSPNVPKSIGLEIRYALIRSSLNNVAVSIDSDLLATVVEHGMWTLEKSLALIRNISKPIDRIERVLGLLSKKNILETSTRLNICKEALEWVKTMKDRFAFPDRSEAITGLAPQIAELENPKVALDIVRTIEYRSLLPEALCSVALHIKNSDKKRQLFMEAIEISWELENTQYQAIALAKVAEHMAQGGLAKDAINLICEIDWEVYQAEALIACLPYFVEADLLVMALSIAEGIAPKKERDYMKDHRARALATVAPYLKNKAERLKVMDLAIDAAYNTPEVEKETRESALSYVAVQLAKAELIDRALALAYLLDDALYRGEALAGIASFIPETEDREHVLSEALQAAREIPEHTKPYVSRLYISIASRMQTTDIQWKILKEAIAICVELKDQGAVSRALVYVARYCVNCQEQDRIAHFVVDINKMIQNARDRVECLGLIAPYFADPEETVNILNEVLNTGFYYERYKKSLHTSIIAPSFAQVGLVDEALTVANRLSEDELSRFKALLGIIQNLQDEDTRKKTIQEALVVAHAIPYNDSKAISLAAIAVHIENLPEQRSLLRQALKIARESKRGSSRDGTTPIVAEYFARAGHTDAALEVTRKFSGFDRDRILAAVATRYAEDGEPVKSLDLTHRIESNSDRASALSAVIICLIGMNQTDNAYSVFAELLQILSQESRRHLSLSYFRHLSPVLAKFGGDEALIEAADSIMDISRWWP